jgi:hypothetical protein
LKQYRVSLQVGECDLQIGVYSAGAWHKLSQDQQSSIFSFSDEFRIQLKALSESNVHHGGFIAPCLVHCVTGFPYWWNGDVAGLAPNRAFLRWLLYTMFRLKLLFGYGCLGTTEIAPYGLKTPATTRRAIRNAFICAGRFQFFEFIYQTPAGINSAENAAVFTRSAI